MFAVVLFAEEECVEVVPVSWLHHSGGECYWPKKDAKKKIKNQSLPDKELWAKHCVRKLGNDYEDYETARKYCRRAEETSNIETDEERKRERKKPAKFSSSESNADTESERDEESVSTCIGEMPPPPTSYGAHLNLIGKSITTPSTKGKAPSYKPSQSPRSPSPPPSPQQITRSIRSPVKRLALEQASKPTRSPDSIRNLKQQASHGKSPRTHREQSEHQNRPSKSPSNRNQQFSIEKTPKLPIQNSMQLIRTPSKRQPQDLEHVRRSPRMKARGEIDQFREVTQAVIHQSGEKSAETVPELLHMIISKLDSLENDIKTIKDHLVVTSDVEVDFVDSILPNGEKLNTPEQIQLFEENMEDSTRRKLINALASLKGGNDCGEICRTLMRALLTNHAMSHYSGTGQKGKLPFIGTPIYRLILSAVRKASKKNIPFLEIRSEVVEVLRNAPNKPGGINYVKKRGRKRPAVEDFPEDSS